MAAPAPSPLSPEEVRAGFIGRFPSAGVGLGYQTALGIAALAMLVLPLVYFGIIGAAGYLVWLWLIHGLKVLAAMHSIWGILVYAAPLVAGAILLFFMVKPLFARSEKPAPAYTLDLAQQPALRAYLEEICRRTGVRLPRRIDLDCQVNASASFRRGLWSLGRQDLVLTIGLPLVRGLTATQLGGVIAHEFGHFAQRISMAFSHIIRRVNGWFARVVFERDDWDRWIERESQTADWRIAIMLHAGRGAIWVSRKLLHGLMLVGHAISCLLLRQMEFDADYYDIRLGGSDSFAHTSRELRYLSLAAGQANQDLNTLWHDRRLVSDYPHLIALRRTQFTPATLEQSDTAIREVRTRWSDTHPHEAARIARAQQAASPGVCRLDVPATTLFASYESIEAEVSAHMYRHAVSDQLATVQFLSAAEVTQSLAHEDEAQAAWHKLGNGLVSLDPPLLLTLADLAPHVRPPVDPTTIRDWLAANLPALKQAHEQDTTAYRNLVQATVALNYIRAGVKVVPADFGLSESSGLAAETVINAARETRKKAASHLEAMNERLRSWLIHAAQTPSPDHDEIRRLAETFAQLSPFFTRLPEALIKSHVFHSFAANAVNLKDSLGFNNALAGLRDTSATEIKHWTEITTGIPYPFPHARGAISVAEYLQFSANSSESFSRLPGYLNAAGNLYYRLLARLTLLGSRAESPAAPATTTPPVSTPEPPTP